MTVPYAEVIGDPIAHSKSPLIHNLWLEKLGLRYDYRRAHVTAEQLPHYLEQRRSDPDWRGCNVTIPHKESVLRFTDDAEPVVKTLQAANCLTRRAGEAPVLVADNTDWSGFMEPIQAWAARDVAYKRAYVIGAGGAAAAVSYALDRAGFLVININRDMNKALALRHRLGLFDDDLCTDLKAWSRLESGSRPALADWGDRARRSDILVNTTPLGMTGYPELDVDLEFFPEDVLVYDIVYSPLETRLLREARRRNMPTVDGLEMLIGQAARAFELFFGEKAPRQFDPELRRLLTS